MNKIQINGCFKSAEFISRFNFNKLIWWRLLFSECTIFKFMNINSSLWRICGYIFPPGTYDRQR